MTGIRTTRTQHTGNMKRKPTTKNGEKWNVPRRELLEALSHQARFRFQQNHNSVQFKVTIVQVLVFIETLKIALKNYISNYACGIDIGGEDVSPECKKAKDDFASADGTFEEMTFQGGFSL